MTNGFLNNACIHMWVRMAMPDYGKTPTPCLHSSIGRKVHEQPVAKGDGYKLEPTRTHRGARLIFVDNI